MVIAAPPAGCDGGRGTSPPLQDVLMNVAPKKANWDLKRDVEKKLDKLERRTQRAILEIMQQEEAERLREEDGTAQD